MDDAFRNILREQSEKQEKWERAQSKKQESSIQTFSCMIQHQQELIDKHGLALKELTQQLSEMARIVVSTSMAQSNGKEVTSPSAVDKTLGNPLSYEDSSYHTKLEFLTFYGEDLKSWLIKVEHFVDLDSTWSHCHICVAALYLEDRALHWYHNFTQNRSIPNPIMWDELVIGL